MIERLRDVKGSESTSGARSGPPRLCLAIDIGGTAIKYGLMDDDGCLFCVAQVPTPHAGGRAVIDAVVSLVERMSAGHVLAGVGISTAGTLDRVSGAIVFAAPTIPDYAGTNWRQVLRGVLDAPVVVENDAVAAFRGELWKGDIEAADDVYYVTLGTGIGGARGHRAPGRAQWQVEARAVGYLLCDGATGAYWETRASVAALNALASATLGTNADARALFVRARRGETAGTDVLACWAERVAAGLAEIALACEPRYIVIGGAVAAQGAFLLELLVQAWHRCLPSRPVRTELRIATLANRAALYGAVYPLLAED